MNRIFNDDVRNALGCKVDFRDRPLVSIGDTDLSNLRVFRAEWTLDTIERPHADDVLDDVCFVVCNTNPDIVEFAVEYQGVVFLVNSEGYDYARYSGRLSKRDGDAVLAQARKEFS